MRLQQYITELSFEKTPEITIDKNTSHFYFTSWTQEISGKPIRYIFQAARYPGENEHAWNIEFTAKMKDNLDTKEALQVFSAVKKSLLMFIKAKRPTEFQFYGAGWKLRRFYNRIKADVAKITKYKVTTHGINHVFTKI